MNRREELPVSLQTILFSTRAQSKQSSNLTLSSVECDAFHHQQRKEQRDAVCRVTQPSSVPKRNYFDSIKSNCHLPIELETIFSQIPISSETETSTWLHRHKRL